MNEQGPRTPEGTEDTRSRGEREAARSQKVTPESSMFREDADPSRIVDWNEDEERERALAAERESMRRSEQESRRQAEPPPRTRRGNGNGSAATASIPTLLRDLAHDATEITRKEVALARSEITHAIADVKTGVISMAAGGGVLFAGILFLLLSATLGLATVMAAWLAALIVGGVVALVGLIMVMSGKRKMQTDAFRPDRTLESMRKDREMIARRTQ